MANSSTKANRFVLSLSCSAILQFLPQDNLQPPNTLLSDTNQCQFSLQLNTQKHPQKLHTLKVVESSRCFSTSLHGLLFSTLHLTLPYYCARKSLVQLSCLCLFFVLYRIQTKNNTIYIKHNTPSKLYKIWVQALVSKTLFHMAITENFQFFQILTNTINMGWIQGIALFLPHMQFLLFLKHPQPPYFIFF